MSALPESAHSSYKVLDEHGRTMVLRFDSTLALARVAAGSSDHGRLKYSYLQPVQRVVDFGRGQTREFFQAGVELYGDQSFAAELEIVKLADNLFKRLNLLEPTIVIGCARFWQFALRQALENADPGQPANLDVLVDPAGGNGSKVKLSDAVSQALHTGDLVQANQLVKAAAGEQVASEFAGLIGARVSADSVDVFNYQPFTELAGLLTKDGAAGSVIFDGSLARRQGYYSSTIFEIFVRGFGFSVGGGGRYDHLVEKFGRETPALGLAFNLDRIHHAKVAQEVLNA